MPCSVRGICLAAAICACASPAGTRRFPDRAPLWRVPEVPFSPAPPAGPDEPDRAAAAADLFFEMESTLALRPTPPALDVNALDEVPDSSFFVNRIGRRPVAPDEVARGGERPEDPRGIDPEGPLFVVAAKSEGVTAGLVVDDAAGRRFLLKFDPPGRLGLLTGSEAVATRLLWAAGYPVPDNRVVAVDPARFVPAAGGPGVEAIARVLSVAARRADGRVQALASRFVPGRRLGPMLWRGTRRGDPNDRIPHEHRRALRALRLFYVWLNNPDAKPGNSLDAYERLPGGGLVRHYLLDFGTSLGAGGSGPALAGWWAAFPFRRGGLRGAAGDLRALAYPHPLLRDQAREVRRRRRGGDYLLAGLSPDVDPWVYRFLWRNTAFERMDAADAAWAARVLVRFRDEHLRAAVSASGWPLEIQRRAVRRLATRRDSVARRVFARASPFGAPVVRDGEICADDLPLLHRLAPVRGRRYLVRGGRARAEPARLCATPAPGDGYRIVTMRAVTGPGSPPLPAMHVHVLRGGRELRIVGVERETSM